MVTKYIILLILLVKTQKLYDQSNMCKLCTILNNFTAKFLKKLPIVDPAATLICTYFVFPYYNICNIYIKIFFDNFAKNESLFMEKSNYFCSNYLNLCDSKIEILDFKNYIKELYNDYDEIKINKIYKNKKKIEPYEILTFSDMHFDPLYKEGSYEICGKPAGCCRENSEPFEGYLNKAGYWGSYEKCNSPLRTFDQSLRFIKKDLNKNPKIIILLGDDNPHCTFYLNKDNYKQNSKLISQNLLKYFNTNENIFIPVIGNHDTELQDQFNFESNENVGFAEAYKNLYQNENFLKNGFYSRKIKEINLKIIALNSLAQDEFNQYILKNPTNPMNMLDWFINELRKSEKIGEDVIIASHFPFYSPDSQPEFVKHMEAIFERFQKTIKFHLAAHTHKDELQCIRGYKNKNCINFTFITPSMTSYDNQNPSFRFLKINEKNELSNYDQFRLDLEKWNKFSGDNIKLKWDLAYSFIQEYELNDMSKKSINKFFDKISKNQKFKNIYKYNYNTGRNTNNKNIVNNPNDFDQDSFLIYVQKLLPNWFKYKNN